MQTVVVGGFAINGERGLALWGRSQFDVEGKNEIIFNIQKSRGKGLEKRKWLFVSVQLLRISFYFQFDQNEGFIVRKRIALLQDQKRGDGFQFRRS